MADQRFSAAEREALWLAHEKKCAYTRELLDVSSFHVDHVLPEKLVDSPDELNQIKARLGLDDKFELTGFENLLPCKPGTNMQKGSVILETAHIHYYLALAASRKALVQGHLARIEMRKNRGRALILLQQCLERAELSPDEVFRILDEHVDQPTETFRLIEEMKFADSEVQTIAKADIAELRNRPIRLGRNTDIDGVTLTNDADEQIHVRTCMEYDAAIEAGYFALTTFDIKMATFFEHQCGLLKALEAASTSTVSYITDPRVGIVDLHLLPFSLFPYAGEEPESHDTDATYQSKIADGTLKWPHFCRQLVGRFSLDSGSFMVPGFPA